MENGVGLPEIYFLGKRNEMRKHEILAKISPFATNHPMLPQILPIALQNVESSNIWSNFTLDFFKCSEIAAKGTRPPLTMLAPRKVLEEIFYLT